MIGYLLDNVWFHENTIIGDCGNGCYQLNGGYSDSVTEGNGADVDIGPGGVMRQSARCLSRAVNSGFGAKTKISKCLIQIFGADLFTDFDRPDIARIFYDLLQGQPTVFTGVMNHIFANFVFTIFAKEDVVPADIGRFEGSGRTEDFHC